MHRQISTTLGSMPRSTARSTPCSTASRTVADTPRRRIARLPLAFACLLAALAWTSSAGAARGPSTQEERDKAVQLATLLETKPWSEEAAPARQWLMTFLSEVPDLTVKPCRSLFGSPAERNAIPAALLDQLMFSSAAYLLQHPGEGAGGTPTLLSGLEGALTAYSAWRAHGGIEALPPLEALLQLKKNGQLEAYVRERGRSCR